MLNVRCEDREILLFLRYSFKLRRSFFDLDVLVVGCYLDKYLDDKLSKLFLLRYFILLFYRCYLTCMLDGYVYI